MATNPPKKPPENDTYYTTGFPDSNFSGPTTPSTTTSLLKKRRSTCSCSNISIMQLFHEMKQKFPTVPDHVVSDLVTANCHNRPGCIESLEKAVLGSPVTGQAYPSQSIHSTSLKRRINERKMSKLESSLSGGSSGSSSRESSVDKSPKCAGDAGTGNFNNNNNRIPNNTTTSSTGDHLSRDSGSVNNSADNHPTTMMTPAFDSNNNRVAPSRPTTLPFSGPRPTRVAPLPPISSASQQSANSAEIGETINVQLNVTVSPVASRSPLGQRHTSTLQLQPEAPYSRELAQASSRFNTPGPLPPGANSRSSTSVNLTLRQPSEGPQSPIHIHASPLKYTAKGFNAQSGIQSKLEITFQDGFGSISAMRTHVPGFDPPPIVGSNHSSSSNSSNSTSIPQRGQLQENPYRDHYQHQQQQQMVAGVTVNAGAQMAAAQHNESDGLTKEQLRQNYLTEVAITHQIDQKNRLSIEVERYRQQLRSIRREIDVLQRPLTPQAAEDLHHEVQFLRQEADLMQKEVDSAELTTAAAAMATGNPHHSSIADGLHALSIEGSPILPAGSIANRPPRPPRPPPPRMPPGLHQQLPSTPANDAPPPYPLEGRSLSAPAGTAVNHPPGGGGGGGDLSTGEQWTCSLCTFQNHELMTTCEVCSLPKVSVTSGQDIHIYLSPGQNKIVHSWIMS
ncbi:beclin-1-like protein B isoform X3 [Aedes albopictus]|uniref:RanBP2-type domain-containing protein n=1 Tax=Aedes albopictus TaxID=7160 RepID=A0ABM1XSP2_AEDAL